MPAYKDEARGTWYASFYYTRNGERVIKKKRGFDTKRDAIAWERKFLEQYSEVKEMTFDTLYKLYISDMEHRIRENTMSTKEYIMELKILPFFGKYRIKDIKANVIREWQNELIKKGYSQTYLKTINNQLSAIMNYAVKYYDLDVNPCKKAGSIGKGNADEMDFYTVEEYMEFRNGLGEKTYSVVAFDLLFWTGMRESELLALTYEDIDFDNKIIHITKGYHRLNGKDVINAPKTTGSVRDVAIPDSLLDELREYTSKLYGIMKDERIFHFTKYFLTHEMERGAKNAGLRRIRVHDLRHSSASMLIEMGVPIMEVSKRLGHDRVSTTLNIYGHLYPNKQSEIASLLEKRIQENKGESNDIDET